MHQDDQEAIFRVVAIVAGTNKTSGDESLLTPFDGYWWKMPIDDRRSMSGSISCDHTSREKRSYQDCVHNQFLNTGHLNLGELPKPYLVSCPTPVLSKSPYKQTHKAKKLVCLKFVCELFEIHLWSDQLAETAHMTPSTYKNFEAKLR